MAHEEFDDVYFARLQAVQSHWWVQGIREVGAAILGDVRPGLSVLDAGCGVGSNLPWLADLARPSRLTALDFTRTALDRCRRLEVSAELVEGSALDPPFVDASFDLIVSLDVLQHLPVAGAASALAETCWVFRPVGSAFVRTNANLGRRLVRQRHDWRLYSATSLGAALTGAGLVVERLTPVNALQGLVASLPRPSLLARAGRGHGDGERHDAGEGHNASQGDGHARGPGHPPPGGSLAQRSPAPGAPGRSSVALGSGSPPSVRSQPLRARPSPAARLRMTDAATTTGALRFCLVTTFYPPASFGGDAVHVRRLAAGLVERGHHVRVVHNPTAHRLLGGSVEGADHDAPPGVEVVALPAGAEAAVSTTATYLTGRPLGYGRRLKALTDGCDVVHFHNPSLLGGPGAFGSGGPGAVRLYTSHEHWLLCPTHVLFRFDQEVCTQRTCWRCSVSYGRPPQLWRSTGLLERAVTSLDAIIAPSRFTAELHRAEFPQARVEVVPPLFWPEATAEGAGDPSPARPLFLFAGRLEPIKGADRLVRAFARVQGADLVVAGAGSQEAELRRLAAGNPAIRLVGQLPRREVHALVRRARAVVVPSVGYETFGGVGVEAMALGTPVVVRDLGPLPELVEGGGGLVFDDDDGLARVLQLLVDDASLAGRLASDAVGSVVERFGERSFFRQYFRVVADVAAARGLHELAAKAGASVMDEMA